MEKWKYNFPGLVVVVVVVRRLLHQLDVWVTLR
jgi:hypothetical protein